MSKRLLIALIPACLLFFVIILAGAGLLYLSLSEYKPSPTESVSVSSSPDLLPFRFEPIELYSWNIGYASLDAGEDFFMDGGKGVRPSSARNVEENLMAMGAYLSAAAPDIVFLQEADIDSKRSYGINEAAFFAEAWKGSWAFAANFRCPFVPLPFPEFIGKVESGLLTLNSYGNAGAERISLPTSFKWPERAAQLKRCLLVERLPLGESGPAGGDELVLVNLHLDAYDSGGSGRIAQTKLLAEFLKAEYGKGNYCVAGGDFNQVFPAVKDVFPIRENAYFTPGIVDASLFGEGWILASDPASPSCRLLDKAYDGGREDHQFYIIDGFILSPNVELISVQTDDLDFRNSDHNPVKLVFSLK